LGKEDTEMDFTDSTMSYSKPEVNTLGKASDVIELTTTPGKHYPMAGDGTFTHDPAYDLDE